MIKRLLAIAVLGAALAACTPGSGSSPAVDPSLSAPTDAAPTDAAPTDMMSAAPSDSLMPSP